MFGIGSLGSSAASNLWALSRRELHNADSTQAASSHMSVRQERQADATTAGTIGENSDAGSSHNGSGRCMFSGSVLQTLLAAQEQTTSSDGATSDASGFEQQLFAKLDADGDGTINKSEFEAAFTAAHENTSRPDAWFDKHGDDSVGGGEEASAPHRGHQGHHGGFVRHALARLDGDGDGAISKSELEAAFTARGKDPAVADALLARFDTDGDGVISTDELAAGPMHGGGLGPRARAPHAPDVTTGSDGATTTSGDTVAAEQPGDPTPTADQTNEEVVTENAAAA